GPGEPGDRPLTQREQGGVETAGEGGGADRVDGGAHPGLDPLRLVGLRTGEADGEDPRGQGGERRGVPLGEVPGGRHPAGHVDGGAEDDGLGSADLGGLDGLAADGVPAGRELGGDRGGDLDRGGAPGGGDDEDAHASTVTGATYGSQGPWSGRRALAGQDELVLPAEVPPVPCGGLLHRGEDRKSVV